MKKTFTWLDKPITWRASCIAALISLALGIIEVLGYLAYVYDIPSKVWNACKRTFRFN